jgi:hypothetical protein
VKDVKKIVKIKLKKTNWTKMKFLNYLNESDSVDFIKKKCRVLLGIYTDNGKYFYRGTRNTERMKLIVPRQDRIPMNMPKNVHAFLDELFYDKFGWKPRSSGVFVSSNEMEAKAYGSFTKNKVPIFLATDPFKVVWSPKVPDLFVYLHGYGIISGDGPLSEYQKKKIVDVVNTYIDRNIDEALKYDVEVMFKCNGYYLIDQDDITTFS